AVTDGYRCVLCRGFLPEMTLQLRVLVCFFFFSSRRRHTRWPRDWSSDVCSSDLGSHFASTRGGLRLSRSCQSLDISTVVAFWSRSEERRVGKECRSRWWRYH